MGFYNPTTVQKLLLMLKVYILRYLCNCYHLLLLLGGIVVLR